MVKQLRKFTAKPSSTRDPRSRTASPITQKDYATISVLREVKELLEKEKKDRDWSSFLLELYREAKASRSGRAFEELKRLLGEEDLKEALKSSEEFRREFKLR